MRIPIFSNFSVAMTSSNQDVSGESRIEKMKKFLSSPLTRKKPSGSQTKTFGTPLDILNQRTPSEAPVPYIVTRICQYIESAGFFHEGLFRISGNARLIERLKASFDQTGDAPLETEGDVASAAALLKLFLRELPDPIIPLNIHQQFLNAVKDTGREESIGHLMLLVEKLPFSNYSLLKYLSYFLMQVSQYEEQNRMSASSLGIVFGPNLFRVAEDFVGLKEQSLTNQIVTYFITDYYAIFHTEPEHVGRPHRLTSSFDSSMKQNHISLDVNHSMVASWPKLSSFPSSLMSSLSLRPLSVSIPSSESYQVSIKMDTAECDEEHILMVDDSDDNLMPLCEQISDKSDKEECKSNSSSARRKRKDRKLIKEDVLASYSALYSMSQFAAIDDDEAFESEIKGSYCPSVDAVCGSNATQTMESNDVDIKHFRIDNVGSRLKKQDKICLEPLLDPQNNTQTDSNSFSRENQRSLERASLHLSPQRSRNSPKKNVLVHPKPNNDNVGSIQSFAPVDVDSSVVDDTELQQQASASSLHSSVKEKSAIPESGSNGAEKRYSYDHKLQRYSKGHRAHYYRKQLAHSDTKRSEPELQAEKHEMQLDGLKSSLDSEEDLTVKKVPIDEFDTSAGSSASCNNGSNSDQRYSWPILKWLQDGDYATAAPANQFLRISSANEAPLSPSAYRSYLSHRSPHLDPNLPPSPPVEQEDLATGVVDDVNKNTIKLLSRKIQSIKRKIKQFDESFEASHGYKPSLAEKSYHPEVKKLILELNQARQELKQLKEPPPIVEVASPPHWSPVEDEIPAAIETYSKSTNTCRFGACLGPVLTDGATVTIEGSLNEAMQYLDDKRKSTARPEALEDMSREQLVEEKFTIQKLLLQFESIHGRPSSKNHRDMMRPLYDRYRNAKRILARSTSFGSLAKGKDAIELQPILEHETMDFRSTEEKVTSVALSETTNVSNGNVIEKNESEMDKEINEEPVISEHQSALKDTLSSVLKSHTNLHELSLPELYDQQQQARTEKRRLRSILREFETRFQADHGRKVQREDKVQMEAVYGAYKNVRAKMKLLEALATKHGLKK